MAQQSSIQISQVIQRYGLEYLGRYYSSYRAIVLSNDDPEDKCRLQVKVPALFGDQSLPCLALPKHQRGAANSGNKPLLPKPGEIVYVSFLQGDPRYPVWEFHGWAKGEMPDELKGEDVAGQVTPYGNKFIFNDKTSTVKMELVAPGSKDPGITITITNGSDISIETKGKIKFTSPDITLASNPDYGQKAMLGETTKELLDQLLTTLSEAKVITSQGPAPFGPDTIARFTHIKGQLDKILSDITKIE